MDNEPTSSTHVAVDAAPLYKVAYDEAVRGLTTQAGVLDNVRTRAGLLITAASVVTAFLAPQAITYGSGFQNGAKIAIVAFVLCIVTAILILWPRDWKIAVDAKKVIAKIEGEGYNGGDLYKWLADNGEGAWRSNANTLKWMFRAFQAGAALLAVEVLAWIAVLGKVNVNGVQL